MGLYSILIILVVVVGFYFFFKKNNEAELESYAAPTAKPSYNLIVGIFPETFEANEKFEKATAKQLQFLREIGFDVSDEWSKQAASFALSSFKLIQEMIEEKVDVDNTSEDLKLLDRVSTSLIYLAFHDERLAKLLMKLYENENDCDDLPEYQELFDWLEERIAPIYE